MIMKNLSNEYITQTEFAKRMGVSITTVQNWKKDILKDCLNETRKRVHFENGKKAVANIDPNCRVRGLANRANYTDRPVYVGEEFDNVMEEIINDPKEKKMNINEASRMKKENEAKLAELEYIKEEKLMIKWTADIFFDIAKKLQSKLSQILPKISGELSGEKDQLKIEQMLAEIHLEVFEEVEKEFMEIGGRE